MMMMMMKSDHYSPISH